MMTTPFSAGTRNPVAAAREVLNSFWNGQLPVDPAAIARSMGVKLYGHDDFPFSGYFDQGSAGPEIHVNRDEPAVRQRFTLAHEIGHFVLGHQNSPRDLPQNFGSAVADPRERAANQFAAELLMPADAVRKLAASGRFASVEELAQAFQVSKVAMGYRLTNLQMSA